MYSVKRAGGDGTVRTGEHVHTVHFEPGHGLTEQCRQLAIAAAHVEQTASWRKHRCEHLGQHRNSTSEYQTAVKLTK